MPLHCWRYDSCVYRIFGWKSVCVFVSASLSLCVKLSIAFDLSIALCACGILWVCKLLKNFVTVVTNKTTTPHRIHWDVSILIMFLEYKLRYDFRAFDFDRPTNQITNRPTDRPNEWSDRRLFRSICPWKTFPLIGENEQTIQTCFRHIEMALTQKAPKIYVNYIRNKGINTKQNTIFACIVSIFVSLVSLSPSLAHPLAV